MEKLVWGTELCKNKVDYYNKTEDSYYWENWAFCMFSRGEWERIGDQNVVNLMLDLWKHMLDSILNYTVEQQLESKWAYALDQLKVFVERRDGIEDELEDVITDGRFKDLADIQERVFDLKTQIVESEVYVKYLMHKEMNKKLLSKRVEERKQNVDSIETDNRESA